MIARKIDKKKNKTGTGHVQDSYERVKIVTTTRKTGTGHQQDREKRATPERKARNISACEVTSKLATKWKTYYLLGC